MDVRLRRSPSPLVRFVLAAQFNPLCPSAIAPGRRPPETSPSPSSAHLSRRAPISPFPRPYRAVRLRLPLSPAVPSGVCPQSFSPVRWSPLRPHPHPHPIIYCTHSIAMSSTQTATQTRAGNARGRGASRGRRGRGGQKNNAVRDPTPASKPVDAPSDANSEQQLAPSEAARQAAAKADASGVDDGTVCWICAEPVKYWSVSECNHRTCHVCALRLRALYKKLECTFCKVCPPDGVLHVKDVH